MLLRPGKYQFVYNVQDGDVRTYDVFHDGQIMETVAKTGEVNYVSSSHAMSRLDRMLKIAQYQADQYKTMPYLNKTSRTQLEILKQTKRFMEDHQIDDEDIRWS